MLPFDIGPDICVFNITVFKMAEHASSRNIMPKSRLYCILVSLVQLSFT